MAYFIAVQKSNGLLDVISMRDYESGIPEGSHKRDDMEKYETLYIPTYFFSFDDGLKDAQMTDFAARVYCKNNSVKILSSTKMTKTTFGAEYHGFHPGLGCVTHGKEHTREIMRARGLVEAGDSMPNYKQTPKSCMDESVIKDAIDKGADISGNEAKALISGTFEA